MMDDHGIEVHVERLSDIITSKTAEFWEERNRALLDLTAVLSAYPPTRIHSAFKSDVLKLLVQPVKELIMDLRSQQVRDTCAFLTKLSEILEEEPAMKIFMRDVFETIFLALKAPHKLMSGYVDECILSILRNTTVKSALQLFVSEVKESKSKHMRERSMDYLGEILIYWELTERDVDHICDAISPGLEDASAKAREFARVAYLQLKSKFPKRAEKLKAHLQVPIRIKLSKMEDEHDAAEGKRQMASSVCSQAESKQFGGEPQSMDAVPSGLVSLQALVRGSITRQSMSGSSREAPVPRASAVSSLFRKVAVTDEQHGTHATLGVPHVHKNIVPPTSLPILKTSSSMADVLPGIGMRVGVTIDGQKVNGTVKFFGETDFAPGQWVGIHLDTPHGKNDGTVKGRRYFTCPMLYGLFSRPSSLAIDTEDNGNGEILRATSSMSDQAGGVLIDTKILCSILKIKIAKSLELLNTDMGTLEKLEQPENFKINSEEYERILDRLREGADEGVNHLHTFKNDVEKLNSF